MFFSLNCITCLFFYPLSTHLFGNEFNIHISRLIIRMIHNFILIVHIRIDPSIITSPSALLILEIASFWSLHAQSVLRAWNHNTPALHSHYRQLYQSELLFRPENYTSVISPGDGRNCSFGFSALILHSIACPPILTSCWR